MWLGDEPDETVTCNHVEVSDGVLRMENVPDSQQRAVGFRTVTHVLSVPIANLHSWKEERD